MAVIIAMSIVLGAELGPKADPTTTTYVPRPEWYFFFLFELLRVIKPPALVPIATIGIPTICMILLFLLPFYDRNPERRPERRPIATTAGILTIIAMALPDLPRRLRRLAGRDRHRRPANVTQQGARRSRLRGRQGGRRPVGLPAPATSSARTATTAPGPELTEIGARLPGAAIARTLDQPAGADAVLQGPAAEQPAAVQRRWCSSSPQLK